MREEQNQRAQDQIHGLSGIPTVRLALGFCTLGLLAALFLTPLLDTAAEKLAGLGADEERVGIDRTVTGSVTPTQRTDRPRRYIIRRSVMQKNPSAPCFLYEDGTREGEC